jgi:hypothetical protein
VEQAVTGLWRDHPSRGGPKHAVYTSTGTHQAAPDLPYFRLLPFAISDATFIDDHLTIANESPIIDQHYPDHDRPAGSRSEEAR